MIHDFNFRDVLAASERGAWTIEEVLPPDAQLDFARNFLPESLARTGVAPDLSPGQRLTLNHIRGHEYLAMFGVVEEFILPFVLDHARPQLGEDDYRVRALLNFAGEEAKHIHLFRLFHQRFTDAFASPCAVIGPAAAIGETVLSHDPLAVALLVLHIEWMTQRHYVDSVRGEDGLDPLFRSLLKHHWIEEAQHAKLDTLMVETLAGGRDAASIAAAVDDYLALGGFLDAGLKTQAELNAQALETATGRMLAPGPRAALVTQQHQALRWTYVGSGMTHPKFSRTLAAISPAGAAKVAAVAPAFC